MSIDWVVDVMDPIKDAMEATERVLSEIMVGEGEAMAGLGAHLERYRGKRVRPALMHLSAGLVGDTNDQVVQVGAVLEALHIASLLHDDVLDQAGERRRGPTVNALHGNQVPVLLGDFLYARAYARTLDLPNLDAAYTLARATEALVRGEIEQSFFRERAEFDEERYFAVIRDKTAALFGAATELGVRYAGGTTKQSIAMRDFGTHLGMAFQIIDDCLDVVGDEVVVGKSLGTDLETGKLTLPVLRLASGLSPERRERFRSLLREPVKGSRRELLQREFDLEEAVQSSQREADRLVHECQKVLDTFPDVPERRSLHNVCSFVLSRKF